MSRLCREYTVRKSGISSPDITGSYGGFYLIAAVFMAIIIVAVIRFYAARGKMVAAEA